jgi:hypothetical protein
MMFWRETTGDVQITGGKPCTAIRMNLIEKMRSQFSIVWLVISERAKLIRLSNFVKPGQEQFRE